jgi:hypothetical protein
LIISAIVFCGDTTAIPENVLDRTLVCTENFIRID